MLFFNFRVWLFLNFFVNLKFFFVISFKKEKDNVEIESIEIYGVLDEVVDSFDEDNYLLFLDLIYEEIRFIILSYI